MLFIQPPCTLNHTPLLTYRSPVSPAPGFNNPHIKTFIFIQAEDGADDLGRFAACPAHLACKYHFKGVISLPCKTLHLFSVIKDTLFPFSYFRNRKTVACQEISQLLLLPV